MSSVWFAVAVAPLGIVAVVLFASGIRLMLNLWDYE